MLDLHCTGVLLKAGQGDQISKVKGIEFNQISRVSRWKDGGLFAKFIQLDSGLIWPRTGQGLERSVQRSLTQVWSIGESESVGRIEGVSTFAVSEACNS